jgi:hypothetical protein
MDTGGVGLGECGHENWTVHGIPFTQRDSCPWVGWNGQIVHAERAGMLGHGYYAAGPRLDVQDVPAKLQPSYMPCEHGWLSNPKGCDRFD